jgi:hypothetical protein
MKTALYISTAVRQFEGEKLNSKDKDIVALLNEWFRNLSNPSAPPKSEKVVKADGVQDEISHQDYFSFLSEALQEIKTDPKKIYMERLRSATNPYDFALILQATVEEILYSTGKIDRGLRKAFYLFYFHRRQLEKAAFDKCFSSFKQIGLTVTSAEDDQN